MASESEHRAAIDKFRAFYDETLCRHVGSRPPDPYPGQRVNAYRVEALRSFKRTYLPQNHELAKVNFRRTAHNLRNDSAGLNNFLAAMEPQLLEACRVEAHNPAHVPRGELKEIKVRDPQGVHIFTKFIGGLNERGEEECFVKSMGRPGRVGRLNPNPESSAALRLWNGAQGV
jgi:hypothetical protein